MFAVIQLLKGHDAFRVSCFTSTVPSISLLFFSFLFPPPPTLHPSLVTTQSIHDINLEINSSLIKTDRVKNIKSIFRSFLFFACDKVSSHERHLFVGTIFLRLKPSQSRTPMPRGKRCHVTKLNHILIDTVATVATRRVDKHRTCVRGRRMRAKAAVRDLSGVNSRTRSFLARTPTR